MTDVYHDHEYCKEKCNLAGPKTMPYKTIVLTPTCRKCIDAHPDYFKPMSCPKCGYKETGKHDGKRYCYFQECGWRED